MANVRAARLFFGLLVQCDGQNHLRRWKRWCVVGALGHVGQIGAAMGRKGWDFYEDFAELE